MKPKAFDRSEHVYKNDAFVELVKDAIRFFNGTPVHTLPPPESFLGTGVYAIYYTGKNPVYKKYAELNRLSYSYPIYVGKAVPKGWRQAHVSDNQLDQSKGLFNHLREHSRSIGIAQGLELQDVMCRFVIFEGVSSDLISTVEAALIKLNMPLWNTAVDGFGSHGHGRKRYEQAKSEWDVIHPGRAWAEKYNGTHAEESAILSRIKNHFKNIEREP
ncbi:MAG: Eco29kI family restriction endonuclease [Gallionella sp.]|nr:Eco29kI family restriction endonuclease [Gallionella sp.]